MIYTNFVETGIFTLEQVIDWMAVKPAEILIKRRNTNNWCTSRYCSFDLATAAPIDAEAFESMAVNTPFTGWTVKGKTLMTFVDGALAWSEEAQ